MKKYKPRVSGGTLADGPFGRLADGSGLGTAMLVVGGVVATPD
jgi:hypothetical protein